MFGKSLFLGISASIVSALGACAYAAFYNTTIYDYTELLGYTSIISACVFVCIFACIMYWAASVIAKFWGEFVFNALFALGSMASIYYPLISTFKEDSFGYFMVYAIPLHFFPVLSWFVMKPLFFRK